MSVRRGYGKDIVLSRQDDVLGFGRLGNCATTRSRGCPFIELRVLMFVIGMA